MSLKDNKIQILPDFIANQIAAGEVVQRPESVVKELVENSLDAGANSIAVVVKTAGKQLIHIVDDGYGMSKENLKLATTRHATSKIMKASDIERILSFGFRGEALASISAVANLEIRTKTKDEDLGWKLIAEPNQEEIFEPTAMENGTQIFVKNLFYNVPARKKFLRANITEFRHISDAMMKFALSYPDKRFTFYDGNNLIFDVQPSTLEARIRDLLGNTTAGSLMKIDQENEFMRISGYIGQPHLSRNSASGQYLFLNQRSIQNRALSHAVFAAFEHLLEKNHKPLFIINLEIDPEKVDINVHPQKHEVKFEDERFIYNSLRKAVSQTLQEFDLTPEIEMIRHQVNSPIELMNDGTGNSDVILVNKITGEIIDTQQNRRQQQERNYSQHLNFSDPQPVQRQTEHNNRTAFDELFSPTVSMDDENLVSAKQTITENQSMYWQMHNKYIFMQNDTGAMIIDMHNAHERVLYERALKAMNHQFANSQTLLFSVQFKTNPSHLALIQELHTELQDLGFGLDIKENNNISLTSVPLDIKNGNEESALLEILTQYEEFQEINTTEKRENIAASYSCKCAIKTGKKLSEQEMKGLATDLLACDMPYVCPHGRPVILDFTLNEIDKRFKRTS